MSGYSIFEGTIADMTWIEVEEAAARGALLILPIAVIEQHGPHLPLATDTYGAYLLCTRISRELAQRGVEALVAPPYYHGMNATTRMFPGSVSVSRSSLVGILTDIFQGYAGYGFKRQFILNHHGDPEHNDAVMEAIRNARAQGVDARYTMGGFLYSFIAGAYTSILGRPLPLPPEALLIAPESRETARFRERVTRSTLAVHAEERETSLIMRWYPRTLSRTVRARDLPPVLPSLEEFSSAAAAGRWRELSPRGYIGDPSVASRENGELYAYEASDIARAIAALVRGSCI